MTTQRFLAADVGNARIKLGLFSSDCAAGLPEPVKTLALSENAVELERIEKWLPDLFDSQSNTTTTATPPQSISPHPLPLSQRERGDSVSPTWWIASVNRPAATGLIDWLREHRPTDRIVLLACDDLPLVVRLDRPDMVGIDRLVDAVAVNRLRAPGRPAVIVDVGTAVTVDLVSADGAFLGGAILPGIEMAARALHHFTDLLPLVKMTELGEPPPALGASTASAMRSGLFWGAVGSIRELIERLGESAGGKPQVFLTGGAGAAVAELLGDEASYVPNLTLSGIAVTARGKKL